MSAQGNRILERMLERLYVALASGPLLNCRPHNSRQRLDVIELGNLDGPKPEALLSLLLGEARQAKWHLRSAPALVSAATSPAQTGPSIDPERERSAPRAATLTTLWNKLRTISEDAKTYEQDTGVEALFLGYPLLHLPPTATFSSQSRRSKRIVAPIALIPVSLSLKSTRTPSITLESAGAGVDRVIPNTALLTWVSQITGAQIGNLFADEEGVEPWREINELVSAVCKAFDLAPPNANQLGTSLVRAPRADAEGAEQPAVVEAAILGLFPAANQGLLSDLEALAAGEPIVPPLRSFLQAKAELGRELAQDEYKPGTECSVPAIRTVLESDPCQEQAVQLSRQASGLVIHGPPGTGKSQTITNIIAHHLAHNERVLFVCDKRTALDVVHHRLAHLDLGQLCAVVHDPRRDQRELYRAIRDQLDSLPEAKLEPRALADLDRTDQELNRLYSELRSYAEALVGEPNDGAEPSLHDQIGQWLTLDVPDAFSGVGELEGVSPNQLTQLEREVREILERALTCEFASNPWSSALGCELDRFLSQPREHFRVALAESCNRAQAIDAIGSGLALDPALPLGRQAECRLRLAEALRAAVSQGCNADLARLAATPPSYIQGARQAFDAVSPLTPELSKYPLDPELLPALAELPQTSELALWRGRLANYLQIARRWYGFLYFGRRSEARRILERFGLSLSAVYAERLQRLVDGLKLRRRVQDWYASLAPGVSPRLLPDEALTRAVAHHTTIFRVLDLAERPELGLARPLLHSLLSDPSKHDLLLQGLTASSERARATDILLSRLQNTQLFQAAWLTRLLEAMCRGEPIHPQLSLLEQAQDSIESVLRVRAALAAQPESVAAALRQLIAQHAPAELGFRVIQRGVLSQRISRRLAQKPILQQLDAERIKASYEHCRLLEARRRELTRAAIVHRWTERQQARLLAATGTRLNATGAEVRRRLLLRGERALRLRQMIAAGFNLEGGDPLFDLRPVWMASPEAVAQIFPRAPLFDVVVFDEASQCRLEEALPLLTRAKRVVIAGDPQQLPPSRFFESGITEHQESEPEDEQAFFESQQAEVEDLLGAALNLSIEQAHLDVHYRSNNADLIRFSNVHFYEGRLQPIPAHPRNFGPLPLRLLRVAGVYEKRANLKEAQAVAERVRELLSAPDPPSIGIGCFNLTQRDAILEALEQVAAKDPEFSEKLAAARSRQGAASFEGLFVKNLENVQGDERDHIIISTTYGPDPKGRFYRRFGPLAQAGGGRRLNVLVTRARRQVDIVTSIPAETYRSLPAPTAGQKPSGAWLLFAYLNFADSLASAYETAPDGQKPTHAAPESRVLESATPSELSVALGQRLLRAYQLPNAVHWGSDGFCIDTALLHPTRPNDVTLGVLCDTTRFSKAPDRVAWDIFRSWMLESQGFQLLRVWSPELFRDPEAVLRRIRDAERKLMHAERAALAVAPTEEMTAEPAQ